LVEVGAVATGGGDAAGGTIATGLASAPAAAVGKIGFCFGSTTARWTAPFRFFAGGCKAIVSPGDAFVAPSVPCRSAAPIASLLTSTDGLVCAVACGIAKIGALTAKTTPMARVAACGIRRQANAERERRISLVIANPDHNQGSSRRQRSCAEPKPFECPA
jgi:hypothetical protein